APPPPHLQRAASAHLSSLPPASGWRAPLLPPLLGPLRGSGSAPPLAAIRRPRTRPHHAGSALVVGEHGGSGGMRADLLAQRPTRAACAGAATGRARLWRPVRR